MPSMNRISSTSSVLDETAFSDHIVGTRGRDRIMAMDGDDVVFARGGNDVLSGGAGFDRLEGGAGNDVLRGGADGDILIGGRGADLLFGDGGFGTTKGSDMAADRLSGGGGNDRLIQGDGNDVMTGGGGADEFFFRWQDPMVALAAGTGRAFTTITDFRSDRDALVFDAAGVATDRTDANFIDGGAGDGTAGGIAASFFAGAAGDSNGEAVMVLNAVGFATGVEAVAAAQDEAAGDLILYFNTTVGVASLLYVDGADAAHSIARFSNINSIEELREAGFSASDFLFV